MVTSKTVTTVYIDKLETESVGKRDNKMSFSLTL